MTDKKAKIIKGSIYALLILIILVGVIVYSNMDFSKIVAPPDSSSDLSVSDGDITIDEDTCIVKVIESIAVNDDYDEGMDMLNRKQILSVEVLSGPRKGEIQFAEFDRTDLTGKKPHDPCKVGAKLLCFFTVNSKGEIVDNGTVTGYYRIPYIIWAGVIFFLLMLLLTGLRGLRSFTALAATCVSIILIMLPMILNGMNPVTASIISSIFSIITTLVLIYGFTVKTFAAALGAAGGVLVAGIFTGIMNNLMHLTGITSDEASQLALHFANGNIDLNGIMFAAIMIGSLGGTIDVGISIASALDEMREHAPDITAAEMTGSGIRIGSDIMSASLNTLILAYVGGAIHLLLMLRINGVDFIDVSSEEMIISEILRGLAGCFGLLFTVPITSFVSAAFLCRGGFGKFSFRLMPTVDAIAVKASELSEKWKNSVKKAEQLKDKEEQPVDLYAKAVERKKNIHLFKEEEFSDDFDDIYSSEEEKNQ